ncbi:MAG: serine/threonine-protein kinase [Byssovorax sp.]
MTEPLGFATFPPGTVLLDKYRIVRELGVGGMGVVLCAEHVALGTRVALKFLLPEFAILPDAAQRFVREARAATRIHSEHVARVIDVGTLPGALAGLPSPRGPDGEVLTVAEGGGPPGVPFIVMEYLEGKDLGRHLKSEAKISIHEAIDFVVQAAEALAQAHAAGVIHRDVKPANLFLSRNADGSAHVKMLDFGIAKVVEETAQHNLELTKTRAVMGSALYMSLEQMRSTKTVDYRTDIYSLGITLYELLTHTHPFMAESFSELCVKVSLDPPDPIGRHRPDVTDELAEVIAKAYARYPDDRYPTVAAFASALAPFAAAESQAMIAAIQRIDRAASGERPLVRMLTPLTNRAVVTERPPPPPRVPWGVIAAGFFAGAAIAGVTWGVAHHGEAVVNVVDGGVEAGVPVVHTVDSAQPMPSTSTLIAPVPSASTAPATSASAGPTVSPLHVPRECQHGEVDYLLPNGMRQLCRRHR